MLHDVPRTTITVDVPILPFGHFFYRIAWAPAELKVEGAISLKPGEPAPYFLPMSTGDVHGPVTFIGAAE